MVSTKTKHNFVIKTDEMTDQGENFRAFSAINEDKNASEHTVVNSKTHNSLEVLRNNIVGSYQSFTTPYGEKPILYTDWTASGRPVDKIERYLNDEVMPFYGNTHTAASITGHQSTCFRHEARQIVAESVNAKVTGKAAVDVVLFTGNGTTAAVNKLVDALGLNTPFPENHDISTKPIVFVSSYEHHSNLLPWRESVADVVTISYDVNTGVDLTDLEQQLIKHAHRVVKIGAFSAASNVTGICTAVDEVSILLHQHNALAFFDYATAAPYVKIDMNPVLINNPHSALAYKDAIFFSGHKFLGGPGCPGVLIAKRRIMPQFSETPSSASVGGGTVFYVTEDHHRYLSNREEREEGGTPHVLGDVKLGLVMTLKKSIRAAWIEQEEFRISQYVQSKLQAHPAVVLLGKVPQSESAQGYTGHYLPIFSFLLRCDDKFLHFHFVAALLNDLFGIQSRGGCMCAGPFSQTLLGITAAHNQAFEQALLNRHEVLRPGFTRLSLPYWMSQAEVDFVVDAILFVAEHGHKFLSAYRFNHMTGEWAHATRLTRFPERNWLSHFTLDASNTAPVQEAPTAVGALAHWKVATTEEVLAKVRADADMELAKCEQAMKKLRERGGVQVTTSKSSSATGAEGEESLQSFEHLRWFVTTEEAQALHRSREGVNELKQLSGPIRPVLLSSSDGTKERTTALAQPIKVSAFAVQRDQKFLARTGKEAPPPRYLTLGSVLSSGGLTAAPSNNTSTHPAVAVKPTMTVPVIAAETTPTVASAAMEVSQEDGSIALDCSTGTCSMRPRTVEAAGTVQEPATVSMDASGKILSGPGRTYLPITPSTATGTVAAGAGKVKGKPMAHLPPKKIMKGVGQAIKDWSMIEEGDRLLLGLSGGKDSLALLHILLAVQKRAPVKFEIACATVDPQTDSFDPSPLIPYVQSLGVTYHYLSEPIVELAKSKLQGDSLCAFCSRFKRGLLYSCCRTHKYNKLVLAQHLDDLVESFLMSALHNGQIRTMKANYTIEAGDVRVIRPLIYVREQATRDFSQASQLPIINENCPACFEQPKERARMKKLMAQEETMVPNLFYNLKRALTPLMHDDTYAAMNAVAERIEKAGLNPRNRPPTGGKRGNIDSSEGRTEGNTEKRLKVSNGAESNANEGKEVVMLEGEEDDAAAEGAGISISEAVCGANGGYCPPCYELA